MVSYHLTKSNTKKVCRLIQSYKQPVSTNNIQHNDHTAIMSRKDGKRKRGENDDLEEQDDLAKQFSKAVRVTEERKIYTYPRNPKLMTPDEYADIKKTIEDGSANGLTLANIANHFDYLINVKSFETAKVHVTLFKMMIEKVKRNTQLTQRINWGHGPYFGLQHVF